MTELRGELELRKQGGKPLETGEREPADLQRAKERVLAGGRPRVCK